MERERLKTADDMSVMENQLNDARREHAKAVAALKNAERQVSREKQQAANMVTNIEREYTEKLARCEKQLKNVEKERNLLMVRIREDRSNTVTSQPAAGKCVQVNITGTLTGKLSHISLYTRVFLSHGLPASSGDFVTVLEYIFFEKWTCNDVIKI